MTTKTPERTTIEAFEMEVVDRADVVHLWRVIAKWRAVVITGVVFVLAATFALLALTPPDYEADTTLLFDQPALIASGQQGLDTAQKLLNLMPTYAAEATGDPVLELVRERLGGNASLDDLRARISATPVRSALAIQIKAHDAHAGVAQRLAGATASSFQQDLATVQDQSKVPAELRYVIRTILQPQSKRPNRHVVRTVVLAALLGLAVMSAIAFVLEYVDRS